MAGFTVAQPGGYSADLDALLVRRDLFNSGNMWSWGRGLAGGLGNGSTATTSSPSTVAGGGQTWRQVSLSTSFSSGIKTDGTLWTWGYNAEGNLGNGTSTSTSSPGTVAGGGTTWMQVSSNNNQSAAIKTDGTLWTWGRNAGGGLGDGTTTDRSSPGTVAGGGTTWTQVSTGSLTSLAIKTDGTLWTWGTNSIGRLGDGTTTNRSSPGTIAGGGTTWKLVTGGLFVGAAIKTDGTLWTWGGNFSGQLGDGTITDRSSPGTVAGGGNTWSQVACAKGSYGMAAIKTDGTLWTWGQGTAGALGNGTTTDRSSPGTVAGGGTTWASVACGVYVTASIKTDGTLWTWGDNGTGALGDGTSTNRSSPGTVAGGGTTWKSVACGGNFTVAITDLST